MEKESLGAAIVLTIIGILCLAGTWFEIKEFVYASAVLILVIAAGEFISIAENKRQKSKGYQHG